MIGSRSAISTLLATAALTLASFAAPPALLGQQVELQGQLRPRWEGRDPAGSGMGSFTSMRTRAAIAAALESDVRVFIEFQDVRLFGEETHPLFDDNADGMDLHEAFAELGDFLGDGSWLRVGRQETSLGGQRLIGAVDWAQQGQSFDGARLRADGDWGMLDLIAYRTNESAGGGGADSELVGVYAVIPTGGSATLDLFTLYRGTAAATETDEATSGLRWAGGSGVWSYRAEGAVQYGTRADDDVSAWMIGGRIGAEIADGAGTVTLWYDLLSGDDDSADGTVRVFETLFATNHKFYGFADLFLNIPAHTGGLGLQDLALKATYQAAPDVRLAADLHSFRLAKQGSVSSSHLGEELDLTGTLTYSPQVSFVAGLSFVAQDDAFAEIGRLAENLMWGYVMMNVTF